MIKKHYYSWTDVEKMCVNIVNQMYTDNWRPDYIVGITRGGNVPATIISNMTGIRCEAIKVSLRDSQDGEESESNCWMAEDAFGIFQQGHGREGNVRFATLTDNLASEFTEHCAYTCHEVNKAEEDIWLVYPWENVAEY
jgi:hypothetical protein